MAHLRRDSCRRFSNSTAPVAPYLHAPSWETYATHDPHGVTILSNGRWLKPVGRHFPVGRLPYGLVMSRDGRPLFIASEGVGQLVSEWQSASPQIVAIQPPPATSDPNKKGQRNGGGAEFSADGQWLYWSGGEAGSILVFSTATRQSMGALELNSPAAGRDFQDSYAVDLRLSSDGNYLYVADVTNFRVVVFDLRRGKIVQSVPVGRYPYALAEIGNQVFVANVGVFEYSPIPAPKDTRFDPRGLTRPPFGFPS